MRRPRRALLGAVGLTIFLACGPSAEDIAEARAQYVAALDGFVVRQEPVPGQPSQLSQDIALDLVVRREEPAAESPGEGLRGITLDVDQVGAAGESRRHWRVWVDTAALAPGRELRAGQVLEDVDYAPGDGFRVEVRRSVPAAERARYPEWGAEQGAAATNGGPAS